MIDYKQWLKVLGLELQPRCYTQMTKKEGIDESMVKVY